MAWQERDNYDGVYGGGGYGGGDWREKLARIVNFSFPIGTYLDIHVRVNIWFIAPPLYFFFMSLGHDQPLLRALQFTLLSTALLFISVLLHEFGHCLGCRRVGGFANEILMWPLGGLAFCDPPRTVWANFVTVAAGPFVTLVLMLAPFVVLQALPYDTPVSLNPLNMIVWMEYFSAPTLVRVLADLYALNYFLLLFNLLLVFYPFDGGRLVQIAAWKATNYRKSMIWAVRLGMGGAVVVGVAALALGMIGLTIICAFGFFACYQQGQQLKSEGAYEPWQQSLEMDPTQPERKSWWQRRKEAKAQKKAAAEADRKVKLEAEVDRILDKVHREGMHSLTPKEQKVLQQATEASKSR